MAAVSKTYIGLSLGNHNSVIAIINKDHRAEVIANEDGEHKTPTYVAFSGEEEYHGSQAKHQFVRNAQNTIMGFRDLLGKTFAPEMNQLHPGFARIEDSEGKPVFVIETENDNGETQKLRLSAHEVTVRYLARLRTTAEDYLGRKIEGAVLALPVSFTKEQKESVAAACEEAGLPLLQLIAEPIAAAMQYGVGKGASHVDAKDTLALVVDVGGTGSDVTLVAARGGLYTIVGSTHTDAVSGDIVDDVLVKHFAGEFKRQYNIDVLQGNPKAVRKMKESPGEGLDFNGSIQRTRFDIMSGKVYTPLLESIEKVIADAGYTPAQVDQVLLCGVPHCRFFPETTEVRDEGELDEVIAAGCAEQAALIAQGSVVAPKEAAAAEDLAVEALAKPLGIQLGEDSFVPVLLQDTPLPASRSVKVALPHGQKRAYVAVAEGEAVAPKPEEDDEDDEEEEEQEEQAALPLFRPAKLLAEMVLELDQADENTRVVITFFVGTDRKLTVTASEPVSGKSITAEIPQ
ncbi:Hsp70 protein-domain-containing protein [Kickxella alabastrina]|uniref:Hsp70 protein-domain-containing protein n=1 Tax=Kickxella alabastrina TaxID=61397 RepID=UPI00221F3BB6|nr:Hsp70 protein-domain-containing protein [Kickxella alabastrina]KAI7825469.1 Hsp70 protein-domain-containing protein [Kickxella alabastrina]